MKSSLSENIRRFRRDKNLTQEQLAEVFGVTLSAVSKWETGVSSPDIELLPVIAEFFGTSIDVLMSYEYQRKTQQEYIDRIKRFCKEKKYDLCRDAIDGAIRCYPNHLDIIHLGAQVLFMMGAELHDEEALSRSAVLFNRALELAAQSTDAHGTEWTIHNERAQLYLCMGDVDTALEILKSSNMAGLNDLMIGYALSGFAKKGEEAKPYLSGALLSALLQMDRILTAYANLYLNPEYDEKILDVMDGMISVYDIFRVPGKVSYLDKLTAKVYAGKAMQYQRMGKFEEMEKTLQLAYRYADLYDDDPQRSIRNIRFCEDCQENITAFDDFGGTARQGVEITMNERKPEAAPTWLYFGKL